MDSGPWGTSRAFLASFGFDRRNRGLGSGSARINAAMAWCWTPLRRNALRCVLIAEVSVELRAARGVAYGMTLKCRLPMA